MATRQYDLSVQDASYEITEGVGGAISEGIRLTVDLAVVKSKFDVLKALHKLKQYILEDVYPPA